MKKIEDIREAVRERYATAAKRAAGAERASCCGPGESSCCAGSGEEDVITRDLYTTEELAQVTDSAALASLGCGNPTALAELSEGEVVLDLGSGGGIDVLLSAQRVGPTGKAYGLDMTDEMLELGRRNQRELGIDNAEFLKGTIEEIPLPDESVDVIISNCVINLSTDKDRVLGEAYRVLRPGGRLAVSDVVFQGEVPAAVKESIEAWSGCLAGALHEDEYRTKLAGAGFVDIDVEITRAYGAEELRLLGREFGVELEDAWLEQGRFSSAFVRGRRPE
ncbi:MAG: arsenite methyltransferase [Gemmatimonadetes bacterium]|uniref:Arsenite methyltransferase n=1 Tax=Candidatus Kutchimonas denitrificans TaxID=3056748 RepID=A0AAE4Z9E9_9BACT|nr:arsenite methyltransferase [Gemmatimonadota bacterium]NIR76088.1 arsenite methyltransferase [Candidatus Kutchimonas denitrificans]NIS00467.1 arsenite methyltransferase [Gemmatimonadota bacterium]NIT66125.1 arsenite methyltransferase [Gemmatimonadota bacterium]NIU54203.1 arsenite methyltransferase [Gemmatimonadota bacterium]